MECDEEDNVWNLEDISCPSGLEDISCPSGLEDISCPSALEDMSLGSSDDSVFDTNNVSRLITEEDLIDSIFYVCDENNQGVVPVSKLVEKICFTAGHPLEGEQNVESLRQLLDPEDQDIEVCLNTYRQGITEWIQDIRHSESILSDEGNNESCDVLSNRYGDKLTHQMSHLVSHRFNSASSTGTVGYAGTASCSSIEGSGIGADIATRGLDIGELSSMVADLQFQNHKLGDENSRLRTQLEGTEEISANLSQELDELRRTLKSQQQAVDKMREVQNENEELKDCVSQLVDVRKELQVIKKRKDRDNTALEHEILHLESQLSQSQAELENTKRQVQDLHSSHIEQKKLRAELQKMKEDQVTNLNEKISELEEARVLIDDLSKINENIRQEKANIEIQLSHTQQQLAEAQCKAEYSCVEGEGYGIGVESDEELMPVRLLSSTPYRTASICSEIRTSVQNDDYNLPSPLCDKEFEDVFFNPNSPSVDDVANELKKDVEAMMKSAANMEQLTTKASSMAAQMRERGDSASQGFSVMTPGAAQSEAQRPEAVSSVMKDMLEKRKKEINTFAEKISHLAAAKQASDKRIMKLSRALRDVKVHNEEMQEQHQVALETVELESKRLEERLHSQLQELSNKVHHQENQVTALSTQLQSARENLASSQGENSTLNDRISDLQSRNRQLQVQVHDLNRSIVDLNDKYKKTENEMNNVKDGLDHKTKECRKEKERADEYEESLTAAHLERQLDLKELWRLVHKEVENECLSDSQEEDTPITASSDSVREQVAKEIHSLRSQLAKSQAALAALNVKSLPLTCTTKDLNYGEWKSGKTHSPSSPLVEALTDFGVDGNQNSAIDGKRKREGCSSADSILDGHDHQPFDGNGNLQCENSKQLTNSCPHLSRGSLVTCATQTEYDVYNKPRPPQIGATRYTVVNTSTGSSTSGVVDLDISSGSNKSEPHGTINLTPKKSVLIVETACSPDTPSSPDDPNDPLCRYRTHSFKRAIERGASGDSSNQSFETCDPASTSPDLTPDKPELPPYPGGGEGYQTSQRNNPLLHPPPSAHECRSHSHSHHQGADYTSSSSGDYSNTSRHVYSDSSSLADQSWASDRVTGSTPKKDHSTDESQRKKLFRTSTPDSSLDYSASEASNMEPAAVPVDGKQSPHLSRRLSTLVEEGSDAEAEESLSHSLSPKSPRSPRNKTATMLGVNPTPIPRKTSPQLLQVPHAGSVPAVSDRPKTPPYKAPPAYLKELSPTRETSQDITSSPSLTHHGRRDGHRSPGSRDGSRSPVCRESGHSPMGRDGSRSPVRKDGGHSPVGKYISGYSPLGKNGGAHSPVGKDRGRSPSPNFGSTSPRPAPPPYEDHVFTPGGTVIPPKPPKATVTTISFRAEDRMERFSPVRPSKSPSQSRSPQSRSPAASREGSRDRSTSRDASRERVLSRDSSRERALSRDSSKERALSRDGSRERQVSREGSKERIMSREGSKESREVADLFPDDHQNFMPQNPPEALYRHIEPVRPKARKHTPPSGTDKDNQLIDLVNGQLEEVELSEADKLLNSQLLEEAKKASAQSKHRGRRPFRKGSASDLIRGQTFDEGEGDDDVFVKEYPSDPSGFNSASAAVASNHQSPSITQPSEGSTEAREAARDLDIKQDIIQGLTQLPTVVPSISQRTVTVANAALLEHNKPFRIDPKVHLNKIREENLAKKRSLTKQSKMPELVETSETESTKGSGTNLDPDAENFAKEQNYMMSISQNFNAFPSLPDETLKKMGVDRKVDEPLKNADHLSDQECEEKFASLSLAFKTDKLTLDKRIQLHQRSRDIAEQNIDKEIESLKDAMKTLGPFCGDAASREVYNKIQHHVEVLEQSTTRVSARAEVHGAVQQEMRLSRAVDVMMQHVENLKILYEKEHTELEETKRLLQENRATQEAGENTGHKRYSIAGISGAKLGGKRRASVAVFPRRLSIQANNSDHQNMDPKSRFQSLVADTALRNSIAGAFRQASLEKQLSRSDSQEDAPSPTAKTQQAKPETSESKLSSSNSNDKAKLDANKNVEDELVYQQGYEEGVRAQVNQELEGLRDQQKQFSDSLEDLMEQNEMEDEDFADREDGEDNFLLRIKTLWPGWELSSQKVRFTLAGLVFFMALLSVIVTLIPGSMASDMPRYRYKWTSIQELVEPYVMLRHIKPPPQ